MNERDHPSAIGPVVIDNRAASRFEVLVDGEVVGFADYIEHGDLVELPHTVVDRSVRGRGIAAILVERVLDDIRRSGRTVVPTCWFVAQFIDAHPDYADLLAS
ncbi:MAG: GNAT family N-acetyltransferase [Acidimicrobiales bacterium]